MFNNVLVVCIGNICRSPVAEEILRQNTSNKDITSAGIHGLDGCMADPYAMEIAQNNGFNIKDHKAKRLNDNHIKNSDLILCMEQYHINEIIALHPYAAGKTFLLGHWENKKEIHDPYKKPKDAFTTMFENIMKSVKEWTTRIN